MGDRGPRLRGRAKAPHRASGGSERAVGRPVLNQPPRSMAMSAITEPLRIEATVSRPAGSGAAFSPAFSGTRRSGPPCEGFPEAVAAPGGSVRKAGEPGCRSSWWATPLDSKTLKRSGNAFGRARSWLPTREASGASRSCSALRPSAPPTILAPSSTPPRRTSRRTSNAHRTRGSPLKRHQMPAPRMHQPCRSGTAVGRQGSQRGSGS